MKDDLFVNDLSSASSYSAVPPPSSPSPSPESFEGIRELLLPAPPPSSHPSVDLSKLEVKPAEANSTLSVAARNLLVPVAQPSTTMAAEAPSQTEKDLFRAKSITLLTEHYAKSGEYPLAAIICSLKKSPIASRYDPKKNTIALRQKSSLFPGEETIIQANIDRKRRLPLRFTLKPSAKQSGFPTSGQHIGGWITSAQLLPPLSSLNEGKPLSPYRQLLGAQQQLAHQLLPAGYKNHSAKELLKRKRELFRTHWETLLSLHIQLLQRLLGTDEAWIEPLLMRMGHRYRGGSASWLSFTFDLLSEYGISRPQRALYAIQQKRDGSNLKLAWHHLFAKAMKLLEVYLHEGILCKEGWELLHQLSQRLSPSLERIALTYCGQPASWGSLERRLLLSTLWQQHSFCLELELHSDDSPEQLHSWWLHSFDRELAIFSQELPADIPPLSLFPAGLLLDPPATTSRTKS